MDFALTIVLMGFAEGMTIVYGIIALIASIMLLWLKSKWGQKWLDSLDWFPIPKIVLDFSIWADGFRCQLYMILFPDLSIKSDSDV